ncbi:MAG: outer membrane lipoprotein carrier protein LolA [Bacteroidota bacterium]|nr:outer membrane lipoprotein carrier protein LolA [Bacteroidota bacterium]
MKVILSILSTFIISMSCLGQNNSLGQNDPEAKQILDKASARIKAYKTIQAAFTLEVQDSQGNSEGVKMGTIWMKGMLYKVDITGQEICSDGKTIWTYDKSSNEVTITKSDPSSGSLASPQKLFTNFYDKDFLYKVNGEQKLGTKTVQEVEMTPTDKTRNFHKIYLYVDKKSHMVVSGKMLEKNGNRYIYTISNLKGNLPLTDASFTFDKSKHPGVEEVDLRQ